MENLSRRSFLQKGSLVIGTAGVAAAAPSLLRSRRGAKPAGGAAEGPAATPARAEATAVGHGDVETPIVARVRDVRTGEIDLFVGQRRVTIRDTDTAARLYRATR